jgi:hypothetical protein
VYCRQLVMKMTAALVRVINTIHRAFMLLGQCFKQNRVIVTTEGFVCEGMMKLLQFDLNIFQRGPLKLLMRAAGLQRISNATHVATKAGTRINSTYSTGACLVKSPIKWSFVIDLGSHHVSHPAASAAAVACAASCRRTLRGDSTEAQPASPASMAVGPPPKFQT